MMGSVLLSLVFTGCDASPTEVEIVRPAIAQVSIDELQSFTGTDGSIVFIAQPVDTISPLPPHARLLMEVSTERGDREVLEFSRLFCSPLYVTCHTLTVLMEEGESAERLRPTLGARAHLRYSISGRYAGAYVYDARDVDGLLFAIRRTRGVESAQRGAMAFLVAPSSAMLTFLSGGVPLHVGSTVRTPHNRVLEAASGERVNVKFIQPTGEELVYEAVIP